MALIITSNTLGPIVFIRGEVREEVDGNGVVNVIDAHGQVVASFEHRKAGVIAVHVPCPLDTDENVRSTVGPSKERLAELRRQDAEWTEQYIEECEASLSRARMRFAEYRNALGGNEPHAE
ncbi:hypothetical protein [Rhodococcus triatomae]|nr:hypothetical protein G419_25257 [Rhodococcus triatomae BKS 15-14]